MSAKEILDETGMTLLGLAATLFLAACVLLAMALFSILAGWPVDLLSLALE